MAGGVDLDGDGWPDAAVTYEDCQTPTTGGGCGIGNYVHAISGPDGTTICDLRHPPVAILYGQGLGLVEDLTGDGRGEIVASAPNEGFLDFRGTIRVSSTVDLPLDPDLDLYATKDGSTTIEFALDAGPTNGGRPYLLLGSFGAPFPGLDLGGGVFLPLESADPWFLHTLSSPNLPPFSGSLGLLAIEGTGSCTLDLTGAQLSALVGTQAYHAFLVFGPAGPTFASHAAPLSFW